MATRHIRRFRTCLSSSNQRKHGWFCTQVDSRLHAVMKDSIQHAATGPVLETPLSGSSRTEGKNEHETNGHLAQRTDDPQAHAVAEVEKSVVRKLGVERHVQQPLHDISADQGTTVRRGGAERVCVESPRIKLRNSACRRKLTIKVASQLRANSCFLRRVWSSTQNASVLGRAVGSNAFMLPE